MKSKVKWPGKIFLFAVVLCSIWGVKHFFMDSGWAISHKDTKESVMLQTIVLPDAPKNAEGKNVTPVDMPTDVIANVNGSQINVEIMAWNSQMGFMFSNGGASTTEGSIMAKNGVNVNIKRQDDCNQMSLNLIKFAKDYKDNPATAAGTNFIAIMGDGAAAWLAATNTELEKLGHEYRAQIIYSCGKSLGEDKFMAPPAVKENPQAARGLVCAAYLRDGDWNIVIKWCADNGIPVNTDEKTYDPDAMNFVAANDFIDAAQKYVTGYKETRDVVKTENGKTKRTGERKEVAVDAVTTWTPGDVIVAENKGGLASIVSTEEYRSQMPNVVIGISKYMQDNRKTIENMILSIGQGGDQVKTFDGALKKAGEISAKVYNEKDGAYWVKYYKGIQEADKTGLVVSLGGSRVHNLADNLELFGINQGSTNVYASVYKVFGDIVTKLYPELVPSYPNFNDIIDLSYINNIKSRTASADIISADKIVYHADDNIKQTVAKRAWSIEFESGSANFTSQALNTMDDLYNQLIVASGLNIEIFGHTDNTGTLDGNMTLSQQRADAVKKWLMQKSQSNFPSSRFNRVLGRGQSEPVANNSTAFGKAKNRRVEIVMGK